MLRYYERKRIRSILFFLSSMLVLLSGLIQLMMANYFSAIFLIIIALVFVHDASVYRRPYLILDDEKLIINNGNEKIEILIKNIFSLNEKNKKLIITFRQSLTSRKMKVKISLSQLKKNDKIQFLIDLKSKLEINYEQQNPEEIEDINPEDINPEDINPGEIDNKG